MTTQLPPEVLAACPVPGCGYKPPANLSDTGKEKALGRHISLNHDVSQLADVMGQTEPVNSDPFNKAVAEAVARPEELTEPPKEEPKKETINVQARAARVEGDKPRALPAISPIDPKKERIVQRTQEWGTYLYKDFNPLLVSGVKQFAQIPDTWIDGGPANGAPLQFQTPDGKVLTFWEPPLKEQLSLSEKDCMKLARAGANFAESPMGQALTAWLEHNAHWLAVGAALLVAGSYGWRVMRIRTEVAQLQEVLKAQGAMMSPQAGEAPEGEAA